MSEPLLIKKYSNRKLYDCARCCYISMRRKSLAH